MGNVVTFENAKVPAHLTKLAAMFGGGNDALKTSSGPAYPVITIKGKVWGITEDKVRTKITTENEDGEQVPVQSIKVILARANPNLSKVFYRAEYEDGASEGAVPDCSSNDGIRPDKVVKEPQAKSCAACPHNVWGTGKEGKGRACSDSRRIAVVPVGQMDKVALLRVPPASLKNLTDYANLLDKKGVPAQAVITRLSFDSDASSPKLVFKPVGFVSEEEALAIHALQEDDIVKAIIGLDAAPAAEAPLELAEDDDDVPTPAPAPVKPKAAAKAPAKPKAPVQAPPAEEEEVLEAEPQPAPRAAAKPKAEATVVDGDFESELNGMLDGISFDD